MNIALVAHDSRKQELVEWVTYNIDELKHHHLYATGTTGKLIQNISVETIMNVSKEDSTEDDNGNPGEYGEYISKIYPLKNNITCLLSGPAGGDSQLGAMIAEGKLDILIFFCDNLIMQGHQNDVSALTRLASLYNIGFATNRTTADMILTSPLFRDPTYKRIIPDAIEKYINRIL